MSRKVSGPERRSKLSEVKQALLEKRLQRALNAQSEAQGILPRPTQVKHPLSFAQQRLWFLTQLEPDNPAYNRPLALRLKGRLNITALKQALNEILQRHEILRATFTVEAGQPVQKINSFTSLTLPFIDLSTVPAAKRESQARQLAAKEAQSLFDLTQAPLLRTILFRLEREEHLLLLTIHHIAFDGWSAKVLIKELTVLYEAFCMGHPSPLPKLPIQYADFAYWQQQTLQGKMLETQLSFWKEKLTNAPSLLNLPFDHSRPATQTCQGAQQSLTLPAALVDSLKRLSRQENVTLFMTLLAAFQTLLYRYTGQEDIVVGTPIAGRTHLETEGLIGFFVNNLVLRTSLSQSPTFQNLLTRVRDVTLGAYAHQNLPFEKLVEELQPERNLSATPLFQVMFNLENIPRNTVSPQGLSIEEFEFDTGIAPYDLTLEIVFNQDDTLSCLFGYNTDLFQTDTIKRMMGHFQTALEGIVTNPETPIVQLPLLTSAERQLFIDWNDTQTDYPQDMCIHQLFEAQVEQTPDAIAVTFEETHLTYRELNQRANQVAHHLQTLQIGPNALVGICIERSTEMLIGLLGILKAGGAYVPLDPTYPQERLAFMLANSQAAVLLSQQHLVESLPQHNTPVLCLDTDWSEISRQSQANPPSPVKPTDLAYVIYTSGSTGKPKGVQIPHRAAVNFLNSMKHKPGLTAQDSLLAVTTLSFDIALLELFLPISVGAQVIIASREEASDGRQLAEKLTQAGVTVMQATPATWRLLLETGWTGSKRLKILCGGEAFPPELATQLIERSAAVWNMYGPTETTVWSTVQPVECVTGTVSIGKPIANTQIYILDGQLQPVPVGVVGELYIGGDGLAQGYLHRPELTAEKFIENPFDDGPHVRLYKVGDLARYLPDGDIEFLGRVDHQVKIRGFRIELGEIEAVLAQHPTIADNVVIVRETDGGEKSLVAYMVSKSGTSPSTSELRRFLSQQLPEYMVPSIFVTLEALPLTPNGKVDRRALPEPDQSRPELENTFVPPRTPAEEMLAEIWTGILGLEQVGVHDNFFELGGHSLLATQVISRIRDATHIEIPLRRLFETPTVAGLVEGIETISGTKQALQLPPITRVSRDEALPLSFAQQRLWFLDQLEPGNPAYNISAAYRLIGQLDVIALEQSLNKIGQRYEVLRTTFSIVDGQPVQVIAPTLTLVLPIINLQNLPETEREVKARQLAYEETQQLFDLSQGPLIRAILLQLNAEGHIIVLTVHHIVSDGWSMGILYQELSTLYTAFSNGQPSPLSELPIQYADFTVWQQDWLQGDVLAEQLDYWKKQLEGIPSILELPTDHSRPTKQSYQGTRQTLTLPKALSKALKKLSQQEGSTLFMTLLAAFQTLLYRYTGQDNIVVGSPIANRNRIEIEGLIGFFVNTLALHTSLGGNPTFQELLTQVREMTLGAYTHQDLPFEKLVEELQPERHVSHLPLFQVMFVLQNIPEQRLQLTGLTVEQLKISNQIAKFDLTLTLTEDPQGLQGFFEYNTDLFEAATIKRMIGHFQTLLESIVSNPQTPIRQLPLLTPTEQQQLLVDWNDTQTDYPHDQCIHQIFEAQVERTPNAIAVIFEEQQLTYRQLNTQANQLAHFLKKQGVGPNVLVGICLERSLEMVVGLLGILKAGGAYVPLDPTHPKERLSFMLTDTQAPVLVTQQRLLDSFSEATLQVVCLDSDWNAINQESDSLTGTTTRMKVRSAEVNFGTPKTLFSEESDTQKSDAQKSVVLLSGENPVSEVKSTDLAYVIYTSGSTGKPKGTMIPHRGLVNYLTWATRTYDVGAGNGAPIHSSISFDLTITGLFSPLLAGRGVHMLPESEPGVDTLSAALHNHPNYSLVKITPAHLDLLNQELSSHQMVGCTRRFIIGGENLLGESISLWQDNVPDTTLINEYGPTETVVGCCVYQVPKGKHINGSVPIGRPIANTQLYILDEQLQPVPVGVLGELYIGGPGLARGYLNRPQLTAEKFIPNAFSAKPGARLYKTGDVVRYLPDGNIQFLGRTDHQVKIRGFRIELGEIETALRQDPAVQEVAVLALEDGFGGKRLVAYLVSQDGVNPTVGEFRSFLSQTLPEYMIPSAFVTLDALPLASSGKIDRQALPALDQTRPRLENIFVAPRTELEEIIAEIWATILGLEQVGVHDNFFELGGHSLLAVQVFIQIEEKTGKDIPLATLFQAPTVEQLANIIRQGDEASYQSSLVPIAPEGSKQPLFLIHALMGHVLFYRDLAYRLGAEQPVYGLQYNTQQASARVEEMAQHYIQEIRTIQPSGPYFLAGCSFGGLVAFEMAQQFYKQGHSVAFLAMFDTVGPNYPRPLPNITRFHRKMYRHVRRFQHHWSSLQALEPEKRVGYVREKVEQVTRQMLNGWDQNIAKKHKPTIKNPLPGSIRKIQRALEQAARDYVPQPYPGRVFLFRANYQPLGIYPNPTLGWGELVTGGLEIHEVPGSHNFVVSEPYVRHLIEKLKPCLDEIQTTTIHTR